MYPVRASVHPQCSALTAGSETQKWRKSSAHMRALNLQGLEPMLKGLEPMLKGLEPMLKGLEPMLKGLEPT
jgi:hypothetical protein